MFKGSVPQFRKSFRVEKFEKMISPCFQLFRFIPTSKQHKTLLSQTFPTFRAFKETCGQFNPNRTAHASNRRCRSVGLGHFPLNVGNVRKAGNNDVLRCVKAGTCRKSQKHGVIRSRIIIRNKEPAILIQSSFEIGGDGLYNLLCMPPYLEDLCPR